MEENEKSKIRTNGRPKMDAVAKKSNYIKFRVNEAERKIFENLHQRFAPHLSEAILVRNSLINSLDNSRNYQELAYQMYCNSGIVMDRVNRTFETKGNSINYKESVFYIPTEKQHSISREEFNQNWRKLIENAETGKREKMSLSDINKVSNGSQITNIDIADILTQNTGGTIHKANETFNNEFGPEQRETFLEDLKKLILGKTTQSGHAQVKGNNEQNDIRSK